MSEELKACPFCGRKPEIRHNADGFSYVLCANDGCYARTDGCLNDNEAAKAWNRRAEPENKPLMYYDEIRNMSLEEMATFLSAGWNHADYEDGDWDPEIMAMLTAPVRNPEGSCSMA